MCSYTLTAIPECRREGVSPGVYTARPVSKLRDSSRKIVEKDDPRGTKYILVGTALDRQTPVGVVGRFASNGRYLIITVYEVTELED